MFGRRVRQLVVLTTLLVGAAAAAPTLTSCGGHASGTSGDKQITGLTHSGHANDDARVVLDALGDHADVGVCARKDPESVDRSWSAPLVALPAALLGGTTGCGRRVEVSNTSGTTVLATVVGQCDHCSGEDISLSPELFHQLAGFGQFDGAIAVTWQYES